MQSNQEYLSNNDFIDMRRNESYGTRTVPGITIGDTGVYYSNTSHELQRSNEFGMNTNKAYGAYGTDVEDSVNEYDYVINSIH